MVEIVFLIGEAGGTKTDWRLIVGEKIYHGRTPGYNAATDEPGGLKVPVSFREHFLSVSHCYLYLAGFTSQGSKVYEHLEGLLPNAAFAVYPDTLGAARAVLGTKAGCVGLLGTGAGFIEYDGQQIVNRVPSLGYILGDEGSAFALGKRVLKAYLRGQLPQKLQTTLQSEFPDLDEAIALKKTYAEGNGRSLATSVAPFILKNLADDYILELVKQELATYLDQFVPTEVREISMIGSIAHFLKPQLAEVANERGIRIAGIVRHPIDALLVYHILNRRTR